MARDHAPAGHAQLFGWAGLFVVGILLRAVCQPLIAIAETSIPQGSLYAALGRSGLAFSSILEAIGVLLVATMLAKLFRRARPLASDAPIIPVRPYLAIAGFIVPIAMAMSVRTLPLFAIGVSPEARSIANLDTLCQWLAAAADRTTRTVVLFER